MGVTQSANLTRYWMEHGPSGGEGLVSLKGAGLHSVPHLEELGRSLHTLCDRAQSSSGSRVCVPGSVDGVCVQCLRN